MQLTSLHILNIGIWQKRYLLKITIVNSGTWHLCLKQQKTLYLTVNVTIVHDSLKLSC